MTLTPGKWINLTAAACGAVGTFLLFKGSFAFEAPAAYMNKQLIDEMIARNLRRYRFQRAGLSLLMVSFLLAGAAQFVD
ncbi:hypothetical protein [Rhodoblastus sp.]|uniref:hypothetical protein n=1 Tax=Rhodoblastus sp. TaxID=1962975 RepID=UPI003F9AE4F2